MFLWCLKFCFIQTRYHHWFYPGMEFFCNCIKHQITVETSGLSAPNEWVIQGCPGTCSPRKFSENWTLGNAYPAFTGSIAINSWVYFVELFSVSFLIACDDALTLCLCNLLSRGGHDAFLSQITCKKARIWTFFWLDKKPCGWWFALFRFAKMPPSVTCCWFQSAFLLAYKWAVNTHTSWLSNFCRLNFFEFEECLYRNFIHWNIFHLIVSRFQSWIDYLKSGPVCRLRNLCNRFQKSCSQKFADHLTAIWYRLQVTKATNGFTFQITNSWLESWPGLTLIPPSETCKSFWAIFAFTTLFRSWNMVLQHNFFHCFRHKTKSTSFYQ